MDYDLFVKKLFSSPANYTGQQASIALIEAQQKIIVQGAVRIDTDKYSKNQVAEIADRCMKSIARIESSNGLTIESYSPLTITFQQVEGSGHNSLIQTHGMIWSNMVVGHIYVKELNDAYFWVLVRKKDFEEIADFEAVDGT